MSRAASRAAIFAELIAEARARGIADPERWARLRAAQLMAKRKKQNPYLTGREQYSAIVEATVRAAIRRKRDAMRRNSPPKRRRGE